MNAAVQLPIRQQLDPISFAERNQILDIYIPLEEQDGSFAMTEAYFDRAYCFTGEMKARRPYDPTSPELMQWLLNIYIKAEAAKESADAYRLEHEGAYFRAQRMETQEGPVLALRRIPETVPTLTQLNMPEHVRMLIMDPALVNGGLILSTATNGQGKTTLISAAVRSRMERFGGYCNTVEDPPELPLSTMFGVGSTPCNQIPVRRASDGRPGTGFGEAMVKARRFYPALTGGGTILMVGEIRTPEAAAETLLASFEGHCVLASFHGASPAHSIMRFTSMAAEALGRDMAKDLLAAQLKLCIHQKLVMKADGQGWDRGELKTNLYVVPSDDDAAAGDLRVGSIEKLNERVKRQREALTKLGDKPANVMAIKTALASKN